MNLLTIDDRCSSIPWDEIDQVVFDVGNVLLTFSPQRILEEYASDVPELHSALMQAIFRSPYWPMMDRGVVDLEQATELMITGHKDLEPYIRPVMHNWVQMKDVITEGVDALRLCKAKGKKAYVLSNYGTAFDIVEQKYDFFRLFDGLAVSYRLKMIKPDPAIYRYVIDTWHLTPARTLFIDDSPANIETAIVSGWQGFCFDRPGKLKHFLNE